MLIIFFVFRLKLCALFSSLQIKLIQFYLWFLRIRWPKHIIIFRREKNQRLVLPSKNARYTDMIIAVRISLHLNVICVFFFSVYIVILVFQVLLCIAFSVLTKYDATLMPDTFEDDHGNGSSIGHRVDAGHVPSYPRKKPPEKTYENHLIFLI